MKKKHRFFNEAYDIKYWYTNDEGFLRQGEETVLVPVIHGIKEKDNHEKAFNILKAQKPFIKRKDVISISYQ